MGKQVGGAGSSTTEQLTLLPGACAPDRGVMHRLTAARTGSLPLVVTARDLRRAGLDPDLARRAAHAGAWTHLLPDAWLRQPGPAQRSHLVTAALALGGGGAVLTGSDACAARGMRGLPRQPDVAARSAPECELADALRPAVAAGRLTVLLNPGVFLDGELICCPDAYVVGCALGVELDSRRHHCEPADFEATLRRHDRAASRGLMLLHVTPRTLRRDPAAYRELVCAAVGARRSGGFREPAGLTVLPYGPPIAPTAR